VIYNPFKYIESVYLKRRDSNKDGKTSFEKQLAKSIAKLGKAYRRGTRFEFSDTFDRLAYIVQYAPIGMAAVHRLFLQLQSEVLPPQFSIFHDEPLHIVSVGAGPGTDLFGVLMGLSVPPCGFSFTRIDLHGKWKKHYKGFLADFRSQVSLFEPVLKKMGNKFVKINLKKDLMKRGKSSTAISTADVIVLNRILSTFQNDTRLVSKIIQNIASQASSDALLAVIDVSLPGREFQNAIKLTKRVCRLAKANSEWVARLVKIEEDHFGWTIPSSIMRLERHGRKITRSGRFFGGVVWLRK